MTPAATLTAEPVLDYKGFLEALQRVGATIEPARPGGAELFVVPPRRLVVNDANLQVWEFQNEATAQAASALVSEDGYTVRSGTGTRDNKWIAPPHFYEQGTLIVLYVGEDAAIKTLLETVLGPQFAGQ